MLMTLSVATAADAINRSYGFYGSFAELTAQGSRARLVPVPQRSFVTPRRVVAHGIAAAARGHGIVIPWTFAGARSGVSRPGLVYLPAAYFRRSQAHIRFPVIEFFHGFHGSPRHWSRYLQLAAVLDGEIAAKRIPPVIGVVPAIYSTTDTECLNAVRGEQDETYLAVDVPADASRSFRTLDTPGSWAAIGYSTGGYCAANLAMHHPGLYRAAASLSGYFTAPSDPGALRLYGGSAAARRQNSPLWWVRTHPPGPLLYGFATRQDPQPLDELTQLRHAAGEWQVTTAVAPRGGHNFATWRSAVPPAIDWLGQRLPGPTAPPLTAVSGTPPRAGSQAPVRLPSA
jgi:enterochelin esterase-like enzyme